MTQIKLLQGDCLHKLKELEDNSVDSVVTDPPYEIGFMGKGWDDSGIAFRPDVWEECYRVLKPGGHLLAFSHSRTYHRMGVAVEDAGFEIRDQILWIYGSGFPKSHNIGKAVDKIQGNEREVVGSKGSYRDMRGGALDPNLTQDRDRLEIMETKGNSPYEGWGTALKPSHEPIVMARKPFKGSVAQNVLEWGTGGINIDECRIGYRDENDLDKAIEKRKSFANTGGGHQTEYVGGKLENPIDTTQSINTQGRFPANIIFDEEAGKILDEQTGEVGNGWKKNYGKEDYNGNQYDSSTNQCKHGGGYNGKNTYVDTGGASRFFYCPKASKKDRNEGLDHLEKKQNIFNGKSNNPTKDMKGVEKKFTTQPKSNSHPTVKPTTLMAYLVRLVTPKGGTVLDPFMGSGSTGKAAVREGFDFIGIEREDEYMEIAKTRIEHEQSKHNYRNFWE